MERKGMSYLTKEILEQFTKKGQEIIVMDSKNEITGNKIVDDQLISASYSLEEKPSFHVGDKLSVKGKELRKIE
ncbi:hypothetical protein ACX347_002580 [Enterococcus faecalis]|nr:hypothetical protein [Enterococcus faecalis]